METTEYKNIEIEFRGLLDKNEYDSLKSLLDKQAEHLGENDKDMHFFILPDKTFQVVHYVSKKKAKLVLKLNKIGRGSDFEEIEVPIVEEDFKKAARMFVQLGVGQHMNSYQKRHDYVYKGVEVALKYSKIWGFHVELERVINDIKDQIKIEEQIKQVARELKIKLMTDKELLAFTQEAEKQYRIARRNEEG